MTSVHEAQKPESRGVWRRNWLALLMSFPFLFCFLGFGWYVVLQPGVFLGFSSGKISATADPVYAAFLDGEPYFFEYTFSPLDFGGLPRLATGAGRAGGSIPIWVPLALIALWIVCREQRRNRM